VSGESIWLGRGTKDVSLQLRMANRHGLIAGATGTGKTVSLQVLTEGFSRSGVPVFLADVKGDLGGLSQVGGEHPKARERAAALAIADYAGAACPTIYWDLFGQLGHPIRTTVSEMGPLLLSNLMELSEAQEGVLNIAFRVADEQGLLLLDLKDLRAMLTHLAENASDLAVRYGNVAKATIGAIQRALLVLEQQGGDKFFGEPALDLDDFLKVDRQGVGYVNVLAAETLMRSPRLYASFLLWLLGELFERLPEVGDRDQPKLVFFFDEAHLLFNDAPKALLDQVEQVVRLIRSKGVGVYFVTQNPIDVPDTVLGQLGNRVQHALRAFTPRDQKAVKSAAETFRANPAFETATAVTQLGVGEALVSTLEPDGTPAVVERALIAPPRARIGPVTAAERQAVIDRSPIAGKYEEAIDRESAYEHLQGRVEPATPPKARAAPAERREPTPVRAERPERYSNRQSVAEAFAKSTARAIGSQIGRQIVRGMLGAIFKR
jgi:DNA double-strand break repair helicase HerA and related ATPase